MRVRCGACRTEFEVTGSGRFACPVCGSINVVRNGGGQTPPPPPESPAPGSMGGYQSAPGVGGQAPPPPPPQPPPPEQPMPKIECPECGFSFIVGPVATVTCPMCSAEVDTGISEDDVE